MPAAMAGATVGAYSTLAPCEAMSRAAAYDMRGMVRAALTCLGLAVMMPGTSVHIWSLSALMAAAYRAAV